VLKPIQSCTSSGCDHLGRGIGQAGRAFLFCCGTLALSACEMTPARMEGAVVYEYPAEAEVLSVDPCRYPRAYLHDRYVYLVGGRWYYPTRSGWTVLREEPQELYRYRMSIVPPRRREEVLRAPPAPVPAYPTPPPRRRP
jgi:hypothetical protein